MSKQQINIMSASLAAMEHYYASVSDLDAHDWPPEIVVGFLGLCSVAYTNKPRTRAIAASILVSLPIERREQITSQYVVPSEVNDALADMGETADWPVQGEVQHWAEPTESDVDAYRQARVAALTTYVDMQAGKVIKSSPRALLTQSWSGLSAVRVLADSDPQAADYPLVEAFRVRGGLDDLSEAAQGILEVGRAWAEADAGMQAILAIAVSRMAAVTTIAEIKDVYETTARQVDGVVNQIRSASS